jgi:hypothetical protein
MGTDLDLRAEGGHLGDHVDVRVSAGTVEIFLRQQRIASHARSYQRGSHTTVNEHMPKSRQAHLEWRPSRMSNWAGTIGPEMHACAQQAIGRPRQLRRRGAEYPAAIGTLRRELTERKSPAHLCPDVEYGTKIVLRVS